MSKPKPNESLFVKCECGCNVLELHFDDFEPKQEQFEVALWASHPGTRPMTKAERVRWCKHVMLTGQPWADHTILSKSAARKVVKFIQQKLAKTSKSKV